MEKFYSLDAEASGPPADQVEKIDIGENHDFGRMFIDPKKPQ